MKTILMVAERLREMEDRIPTQHFDAEELKAFAEGVRKFLSLGRGSVRELEPGSVYIVRFDESSGFCLVHAAATGDDPERIGLSLIGIGEEDTISAVAETLDFDYLHSILEAVQAALPAYPPDLRFLASRLSRSMATR